MRKKGLGDSERQTLPMKLFTAVTGLRIAMLLTSAHSGASPFPVLTLSPKATVCTSINHQVYSFR